MKSFLQYTYFICLAALQMLPTVLQHTISEYLTTSSILTLGVLQSKNKTKPTPTPNQNPRQPQNKANTNQSLVALHRAV